MIPKKIPTISLITGAFGAVILASYWNPAGFLGYFLGFLLGGVIGFFIPIR